MIVKKGNQWCLMHKDGSGPPLGCHDSEAKAKAQETAINISKAKAAGHRIPSKTEALTLEARVLLAEMKVRREFLDLCLEHKLRPPYDTSLEGMTEFIRALDELGLAHHVKKAFHAVAHKIKKVGRAVAVAGAIAGAAHGHQDLTHHRPERDRHGSISFHTPAQASKGQHLQKQRTGAQRRSV